MRASHGARLYFSRSEDIFFNHYASNVELFCCRTSHQDSLDHGATISHSSPNAHAILFRRLATEPPDRSKKQPITSNKRKQPAALDTRRHFSALPQNVIATLPVIYLPGRHPSATLLIQTMKMKKCDWLKKISFSTL
jgi:hypothetical protein